MHQAQTMAFFSFPKLVALVVLLTFSLGLCRGHGDGLTRTTTSNHDPHKLVMLERFHRWATEHGRSYATADEKLRRFEIYRRNIEFIEATNRELGFEQLGETSFTDLTSEEFATRYMGAENLPLPEEVEVEDFDDQMVITTRAGDVSGGQQEGVLLLPESVDWRKEGAVTDIKDQLNCGACWAFAAVAAIEGLHKINGGSLLSLSEQELVDCDDYDYGCTAGLPHRAYMWVKKNGGIASTDDYPYFHVELGCHSVRRRFRRAQVGGYKYVKNNNTRALMVAVARQPVSVQFKAKTKTMQFYKQGVAVDTKLCGDAFNHSMTLVGYGTTPAGQNYWIAKNSWGKKWGVNGYMFPTRDVADPSGFCGLAQWASYPTPPETTTSAHLPNNAQFPL